ncbi:MAG TPA: glycosyltransferase family 2 protein [Mycobacteriales bacterium]|nr:glycosyltransferase family 2 protein [Mycobacteriales bacterium]
MTEPAPVVDVCMLTWNTRTVSVDALRRLCASSQGVPFRVLVRDNDSSDGTGDAIAAALPTVWLDRGERNLGFAAGMNALLAQSTAPYVLLLNGDAWPDTDALGRLVAAAQSHPGAGAVVPLLLAPDGTFERSTWPFPSLRLSFLYATGVRRLVSRRWADRWLLEDGWEHDRPRWVGWAVGAAMLVPRDVLDRVGGLDERFFMYGEDVEWCWRMRDAGLRVWFEPSAVVHHVRSASADQLFAADLAARKALASIRVMRLRRGRLAAGLWQLLEVVIAARVWLRARRRGDAAARHWSRSVVRAHLGRISGGEG